MWYVSHIILCPCILYTYNNHYIYTRKQRVQATNREVIRKWRWMKPRFKMVQGVPLQTLTEQVWAISAAKHGGYDPEMTCAAGCWESYIVSQSLGYNADIIGDMDTPKSSKRCHVGLEWWFWRGSSYNFLPKRNQLGFRSPQRSPVPICSKATRAETMAFDDWILLAEWHRLLVRSGSWSQVAVGLLQRASRTSGAAPQASKMFSLIKKESSWLTRNLDNIYDCGSIPYHGRLFPQCLVF